MFGRKNANAGPTGEGASGIPRFAGRARAIAMSLSSGSRAPLWVVSAWNAFLVWRFLDDTILADNDFVCHYAYLLYLADEFWPLTGSLTGWTPRFNLGSPFLLFNPPPLASALSLALMQTVGVSAALALKILLAVAFLSVPLLTFGLAGKLCRDNRIFPLAAAVTASLFSSELYGLEFFFHNGMVNAALGVPILLAVVMTAAGAMEDRPDRAKWLIAAVLALTAAILTHHLSVYMCALTVLCLAMSAPVRRWGRNALLLAGMACAALLLSGFWLLPSLSESGLPPPVFTWIRSPTHICEQFLTGRLFSSYQAGFFARFHSVSDLGAFVTVFGFCGAIYAVWNRARLLVAWTGAAVLALWVALGPDAAGPLRFLPLYGQLYHYRFITSFQIGWILLAGYGVAEWISGENRSRKRYAALALWFAWGVARMAWTPHPLTWLPWLAAAAALVLPVAWFLRKSGPRHGIAVAGILAALTATMIGNGCAVLYERASGVLTSAAFRQEWEDLHEIGRWLKRNAVSEGKLYSEFPMWNVADVLSVNAARHLLPVLGGVGEVAGWIYENNRVALRLHENGMFWNNPFPVVSRFRDYEIRYVFARSPNLTSALHCDARWRSRLATASGTLFEAHGYEPATVRCAEREVRGVTERHLPGGGYEMRFALLSPKGAGGFARVTVNSSFSRNWRATAGARCLPVHETDLGTLRLDIPPDVPEKQEISLVWSVETDERRGLLATLLGFVLLLGLLHLPRTNRFRIQTVLGGAGWLAAAAVLAGLAAIPRPDREPFNSFGPARGFSSVERFDELEVGGFRDQDNGGIVELVPGRWSMPGLIDGRPCRLPLPGSVPHVKIRAAGAKDLTLWFEGPTRQREPTPGISIRNPRTGERLFHSRARRGDPVIVPKRAWEHLALDGPGRLLDVHLDGADKMEVSRIKADTGSVFLEGESLLNSAEDSGGNAFFYTGLPPLAPHNGIMATACVSRTSPTVTLRKTVRLASGVYDLWVRGIVVPKEWQGFRAQIRLTVNGAPVGSFGGIHPPDTQGRFGARLGWERVGGFHAKEQNTLKIHFSLPADAPPARPDLFWGDVDAVAFLPLAGETAGFPR